MISICIITLGRESIYKTLETLFSQKIKVNFEIVIVLQGFINPRRIDELNKKGIPVRIFRYPHGLGFAYYRNQAIKKAQGSIIAFIDDDEWTRNDSWLYYLTKPILDSQCRITTSGTKIPLTKSYWINCISLLGYPGGANVGFDKMWSVFEDRSTYHICSGNFAFSKNLQLYFNENLRSGAEDVDFARKVVEKNLKILWVPEATLFHKPKEGVFNFIRWHFLRGKSVFEYQKHSQVSREQLKDKRKSIFNILKQSFKTKYLFGVLIFLFLQYFFTLWGYLYARLFKSK